MQRNYRNRATLLTILAALIGCLCLVNAASAAAGATLTRAWGLQTATFEVPEGLIHVMLPNDLAMGDSFSGTIAIEPGKLDRGLLGLYTIGLGDVVVGVAAGELKALVPMTKSGSSPALVLRARSGEELARLSLPVLSRAGDSPSAFSFPKIGHVESPVVISGAFDGDFSTSEVLIGEVVARKLAESPRSLVVESPLGLIGSTEIMVMSGAAVEIAPFRAVEIRLLAPKKVVAVGERSTLTAVAKGLENLEEEVPLLAINRTPEVIAVEGANGGLLRHMARPDAIAEDGSYTFSFDITGQQLGDFSVTLAVAGVDKTEHVKNVSNPPHYAPVTNPDTHVTNLTWPTYHAANVTFPPHTANVSWPPKHLANNTWPAHLRNITTWHIQTKEEVEPRPIGEVNN